MSDFSFLGLSEDQIRAVKLFYPYASEKMLNVFKNNSRFVHYTSASSALSIFESQEVWMRKSSCMNDYMEIQHGFRCLNEAYKENKKKLEDIFDKSFPGFCGRFEALFNGWFPHFQSDTYVTCLSEHDEDEDTIGRLSMWRAYGGSTRVAIVTKSTPFILPSDALKAYTSPVAYLDTKRFGLKFKELIDGFDANREHLARWGEQFVSNMLFTAFRAAAVCTKHPGFREEQEWRVTYCPAYDKSARLISELRSIDGIPQQIFKIPLRNIPQEKLAGIEIKELVERVIVGPTQYPAAIAEAFIKMLEKAGVADAGKRVFVSDIPVRD